MYTFTTILYGPMFHCTVSVHYNVANCNIALMFLCENSVYLSLFIYFKHSVIMHIQVKMGLANTVHSFMMNTDNYIHTLCILKTQQNIWRLWFESSCGGKVCVCILQ